MKDLERLQETYNNWIEAGLEASKGTDIPFTYDCGEASAREDFSNYAELEDEISFDDMFELEKNYEPQMTLDEFIESLNEDNYDYAVENHLTIENAYYTYLEGWKLSGEVEYMTPNEYFEANKEIDSYID